MVQGRGRDLQGRLGLRGQPLPHPLQQGAAVLAAAPPAARCRSCAAPTPPRARSSRAARPAGRPRWSSSTSTTPTSRSSSRPRRAKRTRSARCATPGSTWTSAARTSSRVQYQNANNSVRVSDEFMRAVETGGDFGLRARLTGEVIETVDAKDLFRKMAKAAWECADPGIQYDDTINDWHTTPGDRPDHRQQPVLGVPAPGQLLLQPGQHQPAEVPAATTTPSTSQRFVEDDRADHHRDGHLHHLRRLPDREDRRDHPGLPPARHRLRQPRRAADGHRPRLRLRRRPGRRRRRSPR